MREGRFSWFEAYGRTRSANYRQGNPLFEQTFKNIDDVLWKEAGCSSELDYTEQTSWMLFLKYLDDLEQERAMEAELKGKRYDFLIDEPHQWSAWVFEYEKSISY